jgi:hypothetical protein
MSAGQGLAIQTRRLVAGQTEIRARGRPIAYNSVGICASVSAMEMFNRSDPVDD